MKSGFTLYVTFCMARQFWTMEKMGHGVTFPHAPPYYIDLARTLGVLNSALLIPAYSHNTPHIATWVWSSGVLNSALLIPAYSHNTPHISTWVWLSGMLNSAVLIPWPSALPTCITHAFHIWQCAMGLLAHGCKYRCYGNACSM